MANNAEINLSPEDVDLAMDKLQKSLTQDEIVLEQPKGESKADLNKAIVDKRAMGGATEKQEDFSSPDTGRKIEVAELPQSKSTKNFATEYPMDENKAEGSALSEAVKNSAVAKKSDEYKRGMTKAVDSSSSSSASSSSMEKNYSGSSASSVKKAVGEHKVDEVHEDANGLTNGSATPDESSASGVASTVNVKKSVGNNLLKSISKIESANKHLTKAFEDGSGKDLNVTGDRLIEAKQAILKAVASGETVSDEVTARLDKAAKYYAKAIAAYENDDMEMHTLSVRKSTHNMEKAIDSFRSFEKSLTAEPKETKTESVKFLKKGNSYTAILSEDAYKLAKRALNEKGLYKSLSDRVENKEEVAQTLEVSPLLKGLSESHDALRDAILENADKEQATREELIKAIGDLSKSLRTVKGEVEELKNTPKLRKSIVSPVESPVGEEKSSGLLEKSQVSSILEKGFEQGKIGQNEILRWDVVKDMVAEVPEDFARLCRQLGN